jgi:hypothetical protein
MEIFMGSLFLFTGYICFTEDTRKEGVVESLMLATESGTS